MRTLPPLKAFLHALRSVATYPGEGLRLGLAWIAVLWLIGLLGVVLDEGERTADTLRPTDFIELAGAVVGLVGFCSIAVGWHRFILRDEVGRGLRVDALVWRYAGISILIMAVSLLPILVLALIVSRLVPAATLLLIPAGLLAGAFVLRLSIALPAVALGRRDFSFKDALAASDGNFWQLLAVLLLNALVVIASLLGLTLLVRLAESLHTPSAAYVGLTLSMAFQLFYTLFNASIFTALYGFFVEKRDF